MNLKCKMETPEVVEREEEEEGERGGRGREEDEEGRGKEERSEKIRRGSNTITTYRLSHKMPASTTSRSSK